MTPLHVTLLRRTATGPNVPRSLLARQLKHFMMLPRNVLYTEITRGKRQVVLVGMPKAVAIAVKRAEAVKRYSALQSRLREPTILQ